MSPQQAPKPGKDWPAGWKVCGFNYCIDATIGALRFLAQNDRPTGGEQNFNSQHLLQLADELAKTQKDLLASSSHEMDAMQRELLAWRLRYPQQVYQDGVGVVQRP